MHLGDTSRRLSPMRGRGGAGQSLVEFALVLPILVLLLFGTIQVGVTYGGFNGLINSVREAARYGSVCTGATCGTDTANHLIAVMDARVFAYKPGTEHAVVSYSSYQDSAGLYNTQITVTGCIRGIVFIPFIGNILNWTDPTGVYLKSTENFRVEGQPSSSAPTLPANGTAGGTCP